MGLIRDWLNEMGDMWDRMSQGDATAFLGLPRQGTGPGGTGPGRTSGPGTGPGGAPAGPPGNLTENQRQKLMQFFHQQYNRFPQTEYEFQQWLRANW